MRAHGTATLRRHNGGGEKHEAAKKDNLPVPPPIDPHGMCFGSSGRASKW